MAVLLHRLYKGSRIKLVGNCIGGLVTSDIPPIVTELVGTYIGSELGDYT